MIANAISDSAIKAVFAGQHEAHGVLKISDNEYLDYLPVLFKFSKTGLVTGYMFQIDNGANGIDPLVSYKITGKIYKVFGNNYSSYTAWASGKFSDGTSWDLKIRTGIDSDGLNMVTGTGRIYKGTKSGIIDILHNP